MSNAQHIEPEELAFYAMHFLSKDEVTTLQAHLGGCAVCQTELVAIQQDLALVALSVEPVEPAPQTRERFIKQVARESRVIPIDRGARVSEVVASPVQAKAPSKVLPWVGWAVAAGVAFSASSLYHQREQLRDVVAGQSAQLGEQATQIGGLSADAAQAHALMDTLTDRNAMRVTLNTSPTAKPVPQGRATYVASKGSLIFIANNLEPLPPAKVYELWLIPADGRSPIGAGTFHPDAHGNASVIMPELPKGVAAKAFGVTIEAAGGSPKPTLPILLVGA